MKANIKKIRAEKAQSILEYLLFLLIITIGIVAGTIGFSSGVQNSLGLQRSLDTTQTDMSTILNDPKPPQGILDESYYDAPENIVSNPNNTDVYGGPNYPRGPSGYNYNEWVNNNPDNGNINRSGNTTTGK